MTSIALQQTRLRLPKVNYQHLILTGMLALCAFWVTFALVTQQPVVARDRARGLYSVEGGAASFRWTSSQAEFALSPHTGPTRLTMTLGIAGWPRKPELPVQLESDIGRLATVSVTAQSRQINILLPPGATFVRLHTPVARPTNGDWRWLGVQVFQVDAVPSGLPTQAIEYAFLIAATSVALLWMMVWLQRRGYGAIAAVTILGLALRLLWIADSPPLMHRDELVSLVDAWNLAQTGRDHLGHVWPIAAFEGYGDWISPMLTYLLLPWIGIFGSKPLVARVVVAVFGTLAIPAMYGLVRELRMPLAAICSALVIALSPWQIFLSRIAIPPALVATTWTLCLWAALRLVAQGRRRDAFGLAAAGLALYAYPTMKLAVPLLVVLAVVLALARHGWRAAARWQRAALVLGLIWLPFMVSSVFNPASGSRLQQVMISAVSTREWLTLWWKNYAVYFDPNFYYFLGGVRKIVQAVPDHGMALGAEAFLLLGIVALPLRAVVNKCTSKSIRRAIHVDPPGHASITPAHIWVLLAGALLIAPLPASLTAGNPHAFRASTIAPLYAVLVGIGAAVEWRLLGWLPARVRAISRICGITTLTLALFWQSGTWYTLLVQHYPGMADQTWFYADGELETMQRVVGYAQQFDQIRIDTSTIGRPYIFVLAAQALPPAEAQAQLVVERQPPGINRVTQIGHYSFKDFSPSSIPASLPVLEAIPTRTGGPGYLLQSWQQGDQRTLIVRGMTTHVEEDSELDTSPPPSDAIGCPGGCAP
jgi:4-amino-4-deoxy-L-arabinose transferase-like glycosyltransferase